MSARVWHHGPNPQGPVEVTSGQGAFQTDSAYVVLTAAPACLYVWTGVAVGQDARSAATKHATSLLGEIGDEEISFEQQAQESESFAALFAALEYVEPEAAAQPEPEPEPAAAEAVAAAGTAAAAAAAGAKKKKKRKKKKGGAAGAAGAAVVSGAATADDEEEEEEEENGGAADAGAVAAESAPAPVPEPVVESAPAPGPAEAAVIAELEEKLEIVKPEAPELPVSPAPAPKAAATPVASPEVKPTLAAALAAASPAAADSPSVAAARTYLADSAKAWGGLGAAPAGAAGAAVPPGAKTFSYEELKALRGNSGIDMTRKEAYLGDAEFAKVFGKDRAAFAAQPAWRQQLQKKEVGLW